MLNYIILLKPTSIFKFINLLKAVYSRFKTKTSKNALYRLSGPFAILHSNYKTTQTNSTQNPKSF